MSDNKQILIRVAELKIAIKKAEQELEMIQPQALQEILKLRKDSDSPIELTEFPGSYFSIMTRKTWIYTQFVQESEKALKERKKEEEQTGDATFTETEHLLFKEKRNE